jgi:hypothetical protein
MSMNRRKLILFIKIFTLVVTISVLLWIIFAGGCLNNSRVRIYQGNIKIDVSIMCALCWIVLVIPSFLRLVNEKGRYAQSKIIIHEKLEVMFMELLF